jgi:DNA uptake protein ComE-like DNA-binding protein
MKNVKLLLIAFAVTAGACSKEAANPADTSAAVTPATTETPVVDSTAPAPSAATGGWVDPNSATAADLATVQGLTPDLAATIVAGRPYANMVAVNTVLAKSLNKPQRDSVYTRVWIPIDLNTATDAEILLIPGVGPRMLHEFKEYRPYTAIDTFRREIGKYVDKDEVARLERYVKI